MTPRSRGSFRPVHVTAPLGSILNCQEPAAVASRHLISVGALVGYSGPTELASVVQIDPIWVYFQVSELVVPPAAPVGQRRETRGLRRLIGKRVGRTPGAHQPAKPQSDT